MAAINVASEVHQLVVRCVQVGPFRGTSMSAFTTIALREKLQRLEAGYPLEEGPPMPYAELRVSAPPTREVEVAPGRKFRLEITAENARTLADLESVIEKKVEAYRCTLIAFAARQIDAFEEIAKYEMTEGE